MNIEPLELRIAPASAIVTYTDVDGDLVKITASRAGSTAPPLDAGDLTFVSGGSSGQLSRLDVADPGFSDCSIIFTVTKKIGGDGRVHVGFIDAFTVDLDRVVVPGDLGRISAGDASTSDPGLNLLQVKSLGTMGRVTQGNVGTLDSVILGKLGALKVAGDFTDAFISVAVNAGGNEANGSIGSVFIGGDLTGGGGAMDGAIQCVGGLGSVTIKGDLRGGDGDNSGFIDGASIGSVRIGGSVFSGAGSQSGGIQTFGTIGKVQISGNLLHGTGGGGGGIVSGDPMGDVRIGGDVSGRISSDETIGIVKIGGNFSGRLDSNQRIEEIFIGGDVRGTERNGTGAIQSSRIGNITIGGDLVGGSGNVTGYLAGTFEMGNVRIRGDLIGGSIRGDEALSNSGVIQCALGRIASVTIGGSLIAGTDDSTDVLDASGQIAAKTIGPIKIGGSLLGNRENSVVIAAEGQESKPTSGFDLAIASVTVGGDVRFTNILAGYSPLSLAPVNADASIGVVKVGGDWAASNLVAGAQDTGAAGFGVGDSLIPTGNTALIARIASVTIQGNVAGSNESFDLYGFVAEQIDKLSIGGRPLFLSSGPSNDNLAIPFTNDMRLLEV